MMAMENAKSHTLFFATKPLERRVAELTILYEVSRALQNLSEEEKALHTILVGLTHGRGLGFNRGFILLVDPQKEWLEGRQAMGPSSADEASEIWQNLRGKHQTFRQLLQLPPGPEPQKELRVHRIVSRLRIALSGKFNSLLAVMRSREASLAVGGGFESLDIAVDPALQELLGVNCFAAAPIYDGDEDLGLILADNAVSHTSIELPNLKLLQIYAQEAGAAIQNMRLHTALLEKIALCEKTNQTLRENQAYLLQAERLATIGKMSALLAHEIRTPLVSIGGFARKLLRTTPPDDSRKEEMDIIVSEVSRLEKLVNEVLGYSKLTKPDYKPADINDLIRSVLTMIQSEMEKQSVRAILNLDPLIPTAIIDESQLRQALLNLVTNSIEAMPTGGVLTVATSLNGAYVEISIADTGIGIMPEHFGKLFTPFFTTKISGTGLGLAVVSHVVDNHNGSLRCESIPNQGTSFHLRLALQPDLVSPTQTLPGVAFTREVMS
jgi:signal transduction histidine kinase